MIPHIFLSCLAPAFVQKKHALLYKICYTVKSAINFENEVSCSRKGKASHED